MKLLAILLILLATSALAAPRYYVDPAGDYIGAFDGATPPVGSVEIPGPPDHATYQTWNGTAWVDITNRADVEVEAEMTRTVDEARILRLLFEVNFDQENRIRALESLPAITKQQYRDALKARLKNL